jgi:hypothetical protein
MKNFLTLAMAALIVFGGCTKDDEETQVAVTGVTISPATAQTLDVGGTLTLTATVAPDNATNKAMTWTSSNTATATVRSTGLGTAVAADVTTITVTNAGLITAVAAGVTTITVTTADGSKTASVAVTVKPDPEFTADKTPIAFTAAAGTYRIVVTSNIDWTVAADAAATWLTLEPTSGSGNGIVTVTATDNSVPNAAKRAATVTFNMEELDPLVVAVTQAGIAATLCEKCLWDATANNNAGGWVDGYVSAWVAKNEGDGGQWSGQGLTHYPGATSDKDGRANTAAIADATPKSLVMICKSMGEGWYLPAYEELYNMMCNTDNLNWWINTGSRTGGLNGLSFACLLDKDDWYASSSEYYLGAGVATTDDNTTPDAGQGDATNGGKVVQVNKKGGVNAVRKDWIGGSVCVWRQP